VTSLRTTNHFVESVHTLKMDGLDNGKLYKFAVEKFDLCFTRDFGFIHNAKQAQTPHQFKLLRVVLPQKPQDEFVSDFMTAFGKSDFDRYGHGDDWP
jgi:hypothetical protein